MVVTDHVACKQILCNLAATNPGYSAVDTAIIISQVLTAYGNARQEKKILFAMANHLRLASEKLVCGALV